MPLPLRLALGMFRKPPALVAIRSTAAGECTLAPAKRF